MRIQDISWKRLAEPQNDQYDTKITLEFARQRGDVRSDFSGGKTFFDGKVAIRNDPFPMFPSYCVAAPLDHPNIERACNLLRLWPTVFTQFQLLIESVSIFVTDPGPRKYTLISGSTGDFGKIGSTIDHHITFAEGLVHEMAHHKLRALGVKFESAEQIIKNPSEQKFKSPFRYDCLRPMPAVFQAQYALTYIAALHIEIMKAETVLETDRHFAGEILAEHLPKLEFGCTVIRDHAEVDSAGADFMEGYFTWFNRVVENGYRRLYEFQIPPKPFVHPLDTHVNSAQTTEQMTVEQRVDTTDEDFPSVEFYGSEIDAYKDSIDITCTRPRRLNGIREHNVFDEMVLYLPDSDMAFSLNSSAKAIWELCDGRRTIAEITQKIGKSLGTSDAELLSGLLLDVKAATLQLQKLALLKLEEASRTKSA